MFKKTTTAYWMLALTANGICESHNAGIMQEYSVSWANQDRFPADNVIIPKCQSICKYAYQPTVFHTKQKQRPWNRLCRLRFCLISRASVTTHFSQNRRFPFMLWKKMRVFLVLYFRYCIPFGTTYPAGKPITTWPVHMSLSVYYPNIIAEHRCRMFDIPLCHH